MDKNEIIFSKVMYIFTNVLYLEHS